MHPFKLFFSLSILAFFFGIPLFVLAFGTAPTSLEAGKLLQSSVYKGKFVLTKPDKEKAFDVKVTTEGNGAPYVTFDKEIYFFEKDALQWDANFTVAPIGAQNGEYEVEVRFVTLGKEVKKEKGVVNSEIATKVKLVFSVTDEKTILPTILGMAAVYVSETQSIDLNFDVMNKGNTEFSFDTIAVSMSNSYTGKLVYSKELVGNSVSALPPFTQENRTFRFTPKVPFGVYTLDIQAYGDGRLVYSREKLPFQFDPLTQGLPREEDPASWGKKALLFGAILLMAIGGYKIVRSGKKKRGRRKR